MPICLFIGGSHDGERLDVPTKGHGRLPEQYRLAKKVRYVLCAYEGPIPHTELEAGVEVYCLRQLVSPDGFPLFVYVPLGMSYRDMLLMLTNGYSRSGTNDNYSNMAVRGSEG